MTFSLPPLARNPPPPPLLSQPLPLFQPDIPEIWDQEINLLLKV